MKLEQIQKLVKEGKQFYYTHALAEAKKDGIEPEDVITVILNGEIIEEYPDRKRLLIFGQMTSGLPLHVVCDVSNSNVIIIPTVYIPDRREWTKFRIRKSTPKRK